MVKRVREAVENRLILRLKKDQLLRAYTGVAARDLAFSMVGVFEPIYLYLFFKQHFTAPPLALTSLYYAAFFSLFGILCPLGARLASKRGFGFSALIAGPLRGSYYVLLTFIPHFPWLLPIGLVMNAIAATCYWPGFHVFFAKLSSNGKRASSVSSMNIASALASAIAPLLGGLILTMFGYPVLFFAAFSIIFLSVFIFWSFPAIPEQYNETPLRAIRKTLNPRLWRVSLPYAASGVEDEANGIYWPLFLFFLAISYSTLGFIMALSLCIMLITTYIVGKLSDHIGERKILKIGTAQMTAAWVGRSFVTSTTTAVVAHSFFGISRAFAMVPFTSVLYRDIADSSGTSYHATILREQAINVGRGIFLVSAAIFFFFTTHLMPIFIVAAFATIVRSFVWTKPKHPSEKLVSPGFPTSFDSQTLLAASEESGASFFR